MQIKTMESQDFPAALRMAIFKQTVDGVDKDNEREPGALPLRWRERSWYSLWGK